MWKLFGLTFFLKMVKFNKWSIEDMNTIDLSLTDHINYSVKLAEIIPHSAGRYQIKRFMKAQCPIVERFECSLMMHGRNNEIQIKANNVLKHNFELISVLDSQKEMVIKIIPDEDSNTLTLIDTGIGMTNESESIDRLGTNIRSGTIDSQIGRPNSRWRPKMAAPINQMAEKSQIVSPTCSWAPDRGRDISDQATEQL